MVKERWKVLKMKSNEIIDSFIIYLENKNYSSHTIDNYTRDITTLVSFMESEGFGNLVEVNSTLARFYITFLHDKGYSNKSIARKISSARSVFKYMYNEQLIDANPFDSTTTPKIEKTNPSVAEPYLRNKALSHLERGRVLVFGGGTGNPYFSTDTTASLRAAELNADVILMAKNGVDAVYDSDPQVNENAKKITEITYAELINQKLEVMDLTAASLCWDNDIDTMLFDMNVEDNIKRAAFGENIGTKITK